MASTDLGPPEPHRFSIRLPRPIWIGAATAALVVGALGVRFGIPIFRQQVAIRDIERLGGYVEMSPRGPKWLPDWLGNAPFNLLNDVELVAFVFDEPVDFGDRDMNTIEALRGLRTLSLNSTRVGDAGLVHLERLTTLERLYLGNTRVTDQGLTHLTGLKGLRQLELRDTLVTTKGVVNLQRALPGLTIEK